LKRFSGIVIAGMKIKNYFCHVIKLTAGVEAGESAKRSGRSKELLFSHTRYGVCESRATSWRWLFQDPRTLLNGFFYVKK